MRRSLFLTFIFLTLTLLSSSMANQAVAETAAPLASATVRVSLSTDYVNEANGDSFNADISSDGRYVVFESDASNLVSKDTNDVRDIFVHDRQLGTTERVSVNSDGQQGNFDSFSPAISDDGRIVVFISWATNLVDGDNNGLADVFFHNRDNGKTKLVSVGLNGLPANDISYDPSYDRSSPERSLDISADGRYVVFQSSASNLVANDTNNAPDIFRYDRTNKVMERISVNSEEGQANGPSRFPTISADGQRIAFESNASNLVPSDGGSYKDVFLRSTSGDGNTRLISQSSDGEQAIGESFGAAISSDGRYVAFVSLAENLVSKDTNDYPDVFIRDRNNDKTERVSVSSSEQQANEWSSEASVSADGRYVAFQSRATSLVSGDIGSLRDVFVRDRQACITIRASVNSAGVIGNSSSRRPVIAADSPNLVIAFESKATNLVSNDNNDMRDIFVYQPLPPTTLAVAAPVGRPGSWFGFNGANFAANQPVEIWINNTYVANNVVAQGDGRVEFVVATFSTTPDGGYFVTARQTGLEAAAGFRISNSAALQGGNGTLVDLPGSILPYPYFSFLPIAMQPASTNLCQP